MSSPSIPPTAPAAVARTRACCLCGCSQERACLDSDGRPCSWLLPREHATPICSACDGAIFLCHFARPDGPPERAYLQGRSDAVLVDLEGEPLPRESLVLFLWRVLLPGQATLMPPAELSGLMGHVLEGGFAQVRRASAGTLLWHIGEPPDELADSPHAHTLADLLGSETHPPGAVPQLGLDRIRCCLPEGHDGDCTFAFA